MEVFCLDIQKQFGLRIKELRSKSGISQELLAERAQIDRTYLSAVEGGRRNVSLQNIERIALGLQVSVSYFFSNERFSTKPAYVKKEYSIPFTDRFSYSLDQESRVLSFEVQGLFSDKKEVQHLSSKILGICSAFGKGGLSILVDHRQMLTSKGEPAVYSPDIVEEANTFQRHLHEYSKKTIVLCNSDFMVQQFNFITKANGTLSDHLFGQDKQMVEQAFSLLDINGNNLIKPLT
jgi:transcriptional regulator with XRE-family HTH domain